MCRRKRKYKRKPLENILQALELSSDAGNLIAIVILPKVSNVQRTTVVVVTGEG